MTFGTSAIVNQAYQSVGATNWTTGTMVVNSATGSLRFGNVMNFGKTSTTTLNTTDAIISGSGDLGATSQATSTFKLTSYDTTSTGTGAKFIVNAANNVGSFDLAQSGNKLYLQFGDGGSLTVGEDAGLTSFTGAYLGTDMIMLVGDILNQLKVYDLTESQIQDYFASSTGNTIYTVAVGDGSYWVNTVVPEPAEWAAIFGALALGLALYRRKTK